MFQRAPPGFDQCIDLMVDIFHTAVGDNRRGLVIAGGKLDGIFENDDGARDPADSSMDFIANTSSAVKRVDFERGQLSWSSRSQRCWLFRHP